MKTLKKILIGFIWLVIFIAIIVLELTIIPDNCMRSMTNHLGSLGDLIFLGGPAVLATVICYYIAPYILRKPKANKY